MKSAVILAILGGLIGLAVATGGWAYIKHTEIRELSIRTNELERQLAIVQDATAESEQISPSGEAEGLAETDVSVGSYCDRNPHLKACQAREAEPTAAPTPDLFIERMKWAQVAQDLKRRCPV